MDFGSRSKGKVNIFVLKDIINFKLCWLKTKHSCENVKLWHFGKNMAFWQNHRIRRKSRFPWLSTVPIHGYSTQIIEHQINITIGHYNTWHYQLFISMLRPVHSLTFVRQSHFSATVWTGHYTSSNEAVRLLPSFVCWPHSNNKTINQFLSATTIRGQTFADPGHTQGHIFIYTIFS